MARCFLSTCLTLRVVAFIYSLHYLYVYQGMKAFWATPIMTTAYLVFAIGALGYISRNIFGGKGLVSMYGSEYEEYEY